MGNVSTNAYTKFRCTPPRIKKALGIFRELITTTRRRTTTSGSKNFALHSWGTWWERRARTYKGVWDRAFSEIQLQSSWWESGAKPTWNWKLHISWTSQEAAKFTPFLVFCSYRLTCR